MPIRDENGFELFEHDPKTGRTVWRYYDGEKHVFRIDEPVEKLIAANAEAKAATEGVRFGDWVRLGSTPAALFEEKLGNASQQRDVKYVANWFRENSGFATSRGRF